MQASEAACVIGFAVHLVGSQLPVLVFSRSLVERLAAAPAAEGSALAVASGDNADTEEDEDDTVYQLSVCQSPEAAFRSLQVERVAAAPAAEELVAKKELLYAGLHSEVFSAAAAVTTGMGSKNRSARKRRQKARVGGEVALHLADGEACSCGWEPPPA